MKIRSFFLATAIFGGILTVFSGSPAFADRRCSYACEVVGADGSTIRYRPTNRPSAAHSCSADADCTASLCAAFCSQHPPTGHPDYTAGCSSTQAPSCPATSSRTSTPAPSGAPAPAATTGAGSGTATASTDPTPVSHVLPPLAPGNIGPGHCAYQCRSETHDTRDIGVTVGCGNDSDCTADCAGRCEQNSPPGGLSGNGLGAFVGHCVATDPGPHCILPTASASAGTSSTGPSVASGAGASVSELPNPIGTNDITVIFGRIVRAVLGLVGALALFWFVWGGILWMTARGDKGEVKKAQDIIKNASIGILIIFFAYTLTSAFLGVFEAARGASSNTSSSKTATTNSSN